MKMAALEFKSERTRMRFVFWFKGRIVSDGLYVVTDAFSEYNPVAFHTSCEDALGIHVGKWL